MVETANSENGAGASHPRNGLSRATCSTARRTITDTLSTLSTPLMFPLFVFVLFTPPAIQMLLQQPYLRFTLTDPESRCPTRHRFTTLALSSVFSGSGH